jgi:UDP-N-acetylglucosamine 2-epimerase (non-hydrolysing)
MFEVLNYYKPKILESNILAELSLTQQPATSNQQPTTDENTSPLPPSKGEFPGAHNYFIVSTHREENVDNPQNLDSILTILNLLADKYKVPIIVSTHPRTRKRIEKLSDKKNNGLIRFLKPFGFTDYVHLQMNAKCTISDSGTISEESAILDFPAISLRNSMERPEAQDAGTIILTGFNPDVVLDSIELAINEHKAGHPKQIPSDYQVPDTSWRVLKLIQGLAGLSNKWHGVV